MTIKSVKVWRNPTKTECRIYVHTFDGREGCKYMTTTHWHKRGEIDGNLTAEEWQEAKELSIQDGKWNTIYLNNEPSRYNRYDEEDTRIELEEYERFASQRFTGTTSDAMMETGRI